MNRAPGMETFGLFLDGYHLRKHATGLMVDTTFEPGITVLLGVNGIGKTTLLTSLVRPDMRAGGRAVLQDEAGSTELGEHLVCMLPQRPSLPSNLTVQEVVEYCCHLRGVEQGQGARLIDDLDLRPVAARRTHRLSGGESQRMNLALAFVGPPRVALLDEPTVALDPLGRRSFATALRRVADARSVVVMSTHVASDIEIADHVQVMDSGGISWRGTPSAFLSLGEGGGFDSAFAALLSAPPL
ncbi:MAG: ATP-binding cassette domain-containing protein [Marmoricola sp.]